MLLPKRGKDFILGLEEKVGAKSCSDIFVALQDLAPLASSSGVAGVPLTGEEERLFWYFISNLNLAADSATTWPKPSSPSSVLLAEYARVMCREIFS